MTRLFFWSSCVKENFLDILQVNPLRAVRGRKILDVAWDPIESEHSKLDKYGSSLFSGTECRPEIDCPFLATKLMGKGRYAQFYGLHFYWFSCAFWCLGTLSENAFEATVTGDWRKCINVYAAKHAQIPQPSPPLEIWIRIGILGAGLKTVPFSVELICQYFKIYFPMPHCKVL